MTWIVKILETGNGYPKVSGVRESLEIPVKRHIYAVKNPEALPLQTDDIVEITRGSGKSLLSAAIIFLLPLMFFPAGYFLAESLLPATVGNSIPILIGLISIIAGFLLAGLFCRKWDMPVITRILSTAEAEMTLYNNYTCKVSCGMCGTK